MARAEHPADRQELLYFSLNRVRELITVTTLCPHCEEVIEWEEQFDDDDDAFAFHWPQGLPDPTTDQLEQMIAYIDLALLDDNDVRIPVRL